MGDAMVRGHVARSPELGEVLLVHADPLDLEWVCHLGIERRWHTCDGLGEHVRSLFDVPGRTNLCFCAQGEIDVRDARMCQVVQTLAGTLWYQDASHVREMRLLPTFQVTDVAALHKPETLSAVTRVGAWLVQAASRFNITTRPFVFYHEGADACPMHFHILCLDPMEMDE